MKNKNLPLVFTDAEKCKILKLLLDEHPEQIDGQPNPAAEENAVLCTRLMRVLKDSERLNYVEERAITSNTGTSFDCNNKQIRMAWRAQLGDRKANIREAIDWAMRHHPTNPTEISHEQLVALDAPYHPGSASDPKPRTFRAKQKKSDYGDHMLNTVMELVKSQASHVGFNGNAIVPETDLLESGHLDSLDHIELVMAIEEEYSMEIPDEDAEKIRTPLQIVEYVKKNRNDE